MNENAKKILLGIVVVVAVGVAVFEGSTMLREPELTPTMKIGEGKPGQGIKAMEMKAQKEQAAAAAGGAPAKESRDEPNLGG